MKKKRIVLFVFLIVGVLNLILTYKFKQNNLSKNKPFKEEKLSIMIKEDGATEYTKSSSKDIPKGNYTLNTEKSYCKNNGKIEGYDSTTGTVSFAFIGTDRCFLYFDYYVPPRKAYDAILLDNGNGATTVDEAKAYISGKGIPTFTNLATTNEGMYSANDDLGTSYYFRGAVDNNWLKFGKYSQDFIKYIGYYSTTSSEYITYDTLEECNSSTSYNTNCTKFTYGLAGDDIYWRIIRINGDGSIRMIYTGTTAPTESQKVVMLGTGTQIGTSAFNSSVNSAEYVGYKYELGKQHGLANDSTIKINLENWYKITTLNTDTVTKSLVVDSPVCNDRTASTSGTGTYGEIDNFPKLCFYGYYGRPGNPSLKCANELDKFSVSEKNGNGELNYSVGLITADESEMAGGRNAYSTNINTSYYLYNGQSYWTNTPMVFHNLNSTSFYARSVSIYSSGAESMMPVGSKYGVRPVVSLSSEAKLSGDGTWNNPYVVRS